jgi:hypothetical protein
VDTQAVTLLIGNDLGVRTSFLVQGGMRSPQNGEVDPVKAQWFQPWIYVPA